MFNLYKIEEIARKWELYQSHNLAVEDLTVISDEVAVLFCAKYFSRFSLIPEERQMQ